MWPWKELGDQEKLCDQVCSPYSCSHIMWSELINTWHLGNEVIWKKFWFLSGKNFYYDRVDVIRKGKIQWFGHLNKISKARLAKRILFGYFAERPILRTKKVGWTLSKKVLNSDK